MLVIRFANQQVLMEIRQIRSFLSIAETLHFGRSARLLHLSQPALSLQIKSLEDELGLELLKRNRQGTILTEAGRVFRDSAAIALEQLEAATRKAQWAASGKLGRIRIGFISTAGHEIVPNLMRRFHKLYPEVEFSLRNVLTSEQVEKIQNGALDVGFLRLPLGQIHGVEITTVHSEPLVAVVPLNHDLARAKEVRLQDLRGEKFVMYERSYAPGFHDFLIGILSRAGVVPDVSQTAGEMSTLISLVDSGMGVALLPESAARLRDAKVVACTIRDRLPPSQIGMIVSKTNDAPVVEKFCELARNVFQPD
ncbi:MAG TPA: LysR substrate-binding domain-containing protein [Bryobacteraceae bacterium]